AKKIAQQFPQFQVVLRASDEEEPSAIPDKIGNTLIVTAGHKGRHVWVLGAYRNGNAGTPFEFHYHLIHLDPEYETPEGHDADNPIHALLQKYANTLKEKNSLAKSPSNKRPPANPKAEYIGSDSCEACHKAAFKIWQNSPHPHAYATLVNKAKRPTNRQYDGECVLCHVTGFTFKTGWSAAQPAHQFK